MKSTPAGNRLPSLMAGAALFAACQVPVEQCEMDDCPRRTYEISAQSLHDDPLRAVPIDTVDTGRLYLQVRWKTSGLPKGAAAAGTDCVGCEDILENSRLTLDQPLIAGTDTLPAFTNLLAEGVLPKVGTGGPSSLIFHKGVRFKRGENLIAFTSEFRSGSRKIGSLSLQRTLQVGELSSW